MKEEKINPFEMAKKQIAPKFQRGSGYLFGEKNPHENIRPGSWNWTGSGGDRAEGNLSVSTDH